MAKKARGRRVWVLRFVADSGDRRVHRSIYLGGPEHQELVERTRQFLDDLRWLNELPEEAALYCRLAARLVRLFKLRGRRSA